MYYKKEDKSFDYKDTLFNKIVFGKKKLKQSSLELSPYETAHINHIYVFALIVSIVFLISGILFILYANKLAKEETINYIQIATEQIKFAVIEHVNEEFNTLMAAAIIPGNRDFTQEKYFTQLVKVLADYNTYIRVGIVDTRGNAVWMDRSGIGKANLLEESHIQEGLKGKNVIAEIQKAGISETDVMFYVVPIKGEEDGAIKGVLFAADPESEFKKIINNSLYAGKGLAHIINSNGDYIVKSDSPLVAGIGNNIFELPTPLSKSKEWEIRENLETDRPGHFKHAIYDENRLVAYTPLGIHDWFIFYAVPEYMVSAGLKNVTIGAIAVISIAVILFIFFIIHIKQVHKNNRKILERLAFMDPLTGRRNYQKFLLDAAELLKNTNNVKYAVFYCDIKAFKTINDMFGRDTGDRLLRYLSDFIHEITQEGEVTGRINGDIFVGVQKYHTRQEIEDRFTSTVQRLIVFPETFSRGYKVELFGGAYLVNDEEEGLSLNDMLDRAITAQELAKTGSRGKRFCFYSHEMREQKLWEAEVKSKMEIALENNEFQIYLQPKIDIQHGNQIMGAEALVRWISPEKGLIPPNRFISIFEKNGFVVKLDRFIFEEACRYYKESILDKDLPPYILSVNVSRIGLMQSDFIRTYLFIKEFYGIPDGFIELEFTESFVIENHTLFQSIVNECRLNGFLCSLDDFGAGYSSLNILKSIHVDVLKLDGLFFRYDNESDRGRELVKNVIAMAQALNMKTVAEGVDESYQVEQLREMGCNAVQGYIFAKPMPIKEFEEFSRLWSLNRKYHVHPDFFP